MGRLRQVVIAGLVAVVTVTPAFADKKAYKRCLKVCEGALNTCIKEMAKKGKPAIFCNKSHLDCILPCERLK
jgi:hypothetical protein